MTDFSEPEFIEHKQIVSRIDPGVTLITGNLRLAHSLQQGFDQMCMERAEQVWETADILPWNAWLRRSLSHIIDAHEAEKAPLLLSDVQERLLWEQVIDKAVTDRAMLQLSATARQCASAWELMHAWQLGKDDFHYLHNEDSRAFLFWCEAFDQRCQQESWITLAQLPAVMCKLISSGRLQLPDRIILTGFDELTPQQRLLLQTMQQHSCAIEWLEKKPLTTDVSTVRFEHVREEIEHAARWARHIVQNDCSAKVAIVVPELGELKTMLQGIFDRVFVPPSLHPGVYDFQRPYNISLGRTLIQYPLVQTALLILRWQKKRFALEEVSLILQSPYIGGWEQERFSRAQLDRQLREYGQADITMGMLMSCAGNNAEPYHCPLLHAMLLRYRTLINELPQQCSTTEWSRLFTGLLAAFEFSRGRTLSSEEYQTVEAWNNMLCDLVKLDHIGGSMNIHQTNRILMQAASERIFQPRSDEVAVQVLGVMEASGLEFDYLWAMGMHDGIWPPIPRPNPFIPAALQRQRMMPHSSARRELQVAAQITARLAGNAREVIFSYPARNHDDVLRPSPLLQSFQKRDREQLPQWQQNLWRSAIFSSAQLEKWHDTKVPLADVHKVRGGSQIFKLQASCPFRAFAELRLAARPMTEAGMGLDPAQRGSLLHQVMEYIWQRTMNQLNLLKLSANDLHDRITDSVARAIDGLEQQTGQTFNQRFRLLEQERLQQLVYAWLEVEKQRQPFAVIATEQTIELCIKDMRIRLKIDRIDELESGERLLIDYKTGSVTPAQWFGSRPEEPQLPLYSLALPEQLSGLLFAQLKSGESQFKGITREQGVIAGVKSCEQLPQARAAGDWAGLMEQWKQAMESLAEEYKQGHAAVAPLKYPGSCQYCSLTQLCRIHELSGPNTAYSEEDL